MSPRRPGARSVGVDTGGTFTDFVAAVGGRLVALKVPSTPRAPERAVLSGLRRLGAGRGTRVRHGSTLATNTLLERKGAAVALVTTAGFEDLIEIGRQDRGELYALAPRAREPLVPASRRFGVPERLGPGGERWRPLTRAAVARVVAQVRGSGARAVAVGLLHSYADPAHERRLERALRRLELPVTASSALCPEVREFERFSTTVVNAYLVPRVATYLGRLARASAARFEIVLSHGGTAPPALAAREPARQLLSGPAAGLRAASEIARACGFRRALTLDVGGTSTDCAYVAGELPRRRAREVAGFPLLLPVLDVHTIGAGGGSMVRVDPGGLVHVGPESAGADPGPACYGRGGPPTLTDALVVLGRLPGSALAGGALRLHRERSARALAGVAKRLGAGDPVAAAEGVVRIGEAHMAAALRVVSVERGHDPRGAALVAFGGAGGLHACALAEALGCSTVLFPRHAGVLSAIGAWGGGSRREKSRSVLLAASDRAALERACRELEAAVRREFTAADRKRLRWQRWAEVRYLGQSHELSLPVTADLERRFHREHRRRFGFADPTTPVEVVTVEVRGAVAGERPPREPTGAGHPADRGEAGAGRTRVRDRGRWLEARWWSRESLAPGFRAHGPAIVLESGATLWVPPRWTLRLHAAGAVVVER